MKFNDYTLRGGTIMSRRVYQTEALAEHAVATCAKMLTLLRQGADWVTHDIPGMVEFGVSLGPPQWLLDTMGERVEAPNRFFCVSERGQDAFQFNIVLDAGPLTEQDDRAVATALALSLMGDLSGKTQNLSSEEAIEMQVREITQTRPVLATALTPNYAISRDVVMIAADFSTCFAAAMLLETI